MIQSIYKQTKVIIWDDGEEEAAPEQPVVVQYYESDGSISLSTGSNEITFNVRQSPELRKVLLNIEKGKYTEDKA